MSEDKGYSLLVKNILEKESIDLSNLPADQKKNFDLAAEDLFERAFYLDAAKVWAMTKNQERLKSAAEVYFKKGNFVEAFFAFNAIKDYEGLNRTGDAFLKVPDVKFALLCYEASKNEMMSSFIKINL